jgi:hypothetical protein
MLQHLGTQKPIIHGPAEHWFIMSSEFLLNLSTQSPTRDAPAGHSFLIFLCNQVLSCTSQMVRRRLHLLFGAVTEYSEPITHGPVEYLFIKLTDGLIGHRSFVNALQWCNISVAAVANRIF